MCNDTTGASNPKHVLEIVFEPTRAIEGDQLEKIGKCGTVEPQVDGERRERKVGMTSTSTLLLTFPRLCREWNRINTVEPHLDALHVSPVDLLKNRRACAKCSGR